MPVHIDLTSPPIQAQKQSALAFVDSSSNVININILILAI
jgi:hypothetical protein